jgi:hypothetical protein
MVGWTQRLRVMNDSAGVIERNLVSQREISGVLTRLPCVFEAELTDIVPQDRSYVAAEMTAFLLFWLSQLTCPVLNRPTPTNLSGPNWRREKWVRVAAQAGIPVQPVRRHAALTGCRTEEDTLLTTSTLTVIGDRIFGESASRLHQQALCLAQLAGVDLLEVHFSGPDGGARFVSADVFPSLSDDRVADAVLEFFQNGRRQ